MESSTLEGGIYKGGNNGSSASDEVKFHDIGAPLYGVYPVVGITDPLLHTLSLKVGVHKLTRVTRITAY